MSAVLIAGGGSGGHIYPGLAIAECLEHYEPLFACSERAVDRRILEAAGVRFEPVPAQPLSFHPVRYVRLVRGFYAAKARLRLLAREANVKHVLAMGGFVSIPAVAVAHQLQLPCTLMNLDDPPGKANRFAARACDVILSAVPITKPRMHHTVVGMPIRRAAIAEGPADAARTELGLAPNRATLLILGGSQGATSLNRFVPALAAAHPDAFRDWQVLHIAGAGDDAGPKQAWDDAGVPAVVLPYCHAMGRVWGAADLAICRAGASTVAEAALNGVPAIFLPYPYHRDQHQARNAAPLVEAGAAVLADDRVEPDANVASVGPVVIELLHDESRRTAMRAALEALPRTDAAATVAARIEGRAS